MTDVVMPGMSGRELAEQIRTLRPTIQVLFVSGYTDDAILRHAIRHTHLAFLQKPYTTQTLAQKLRKMLEE